MQIQNKILVFFLFFLITSNLKSQQKEFLFKTGDLVFQDLDSSPLCDAIESVTTSFDKKNISHIGIIYYNKKKHYVIEALNGVDTILLDKFLNRSVDSNGNPKVFVGRLKPKHSFLIPIAINKAISLIGMSYDDEFKLNNNKYYCSELIYDIFLYANNNIPFFKLQPMTYKKDGITLDLWLDYFEQLNTPVPEGKPGINPGGISLSEKVEIIYSYY